MTSPGKDPKTFHEKDAGKAILFEMMQMLVRTLEERDSYTRGHSERVSRLAYMMGQKLGLKGEDLARLTRGALLHDIGKIGIRDEILYKPGDFTPDERARMNKHPEKGHFIALNSRLLWDLIPIIRNHHENWDGSGYPDNMKKDQIPLEVRIVTIADFYDALATARPYKKAFTKDKSLGIIDHLIDIKFDPSVMKAFHDCVDDFHTKFIEPFNANPDFGGNT